VARKRTPMTNHMENGKRSHEGILVTDEAIKIRFRAAAATILWADREHTRCFLVSGIK
jgi:hypothetical protein